MLALKIQKFIAANIEDLTKDQIRKLLEIGSEVKPRKASVRRTVTKPILVKESTYMRQGQKIKRKAHRRARREKAV